MADFTEVAPRVWVARYDWLDVNVTLIGGDRGLVMVDTHALGAGGPRGRGDVRRLGAGDVVAVVNTHEHFDHTFGNAVLRDEYGAIPIHAHEWAAEHTVVRRRTHQARYADADDPHRDEVLATRIVPPTRRSPPPRSLDLGDRQVELIHPGRGHTAGDLVVRVAGRRRAPRGRPGGGVRVPVVRRGLLSVRVAGQPSTWSSAC